MAELPTTTKQGANYRPMVKFGFLHVLEYRPSCRQKSHASRTTPRARIISQTFIAGEGKFGRCMRFFLLSPSIIRAARTGSLANNRRVLRRVVLVTCCLVLLMIPCKDPVLLSPLKSTREFSRSLPSPSLAEGGTLDTLLLTFFWVCIAVYFPSLVTTYYCCKKVYNVQDFIYLPVI
ncbi:hypothetical protein E2C01_068097 [Portunus trituberculatus]|uniref:Uncharacterized protein n=1 Tax=Portunus trituberculatus TaxID=210409 RepID=A0A5B7HN00_PORTR|nr:hypothetical protein [Portunus trituberculatus]